MATDDPQETRTFESVYRHKDQMASEVRAKYLKAIEGLLV